MRVQCQAPVCSPAEALQSVLVVELRVEELCSQGRGRRTAEYPFLLPHTPVSTCGTIRGTLGMQQNGVTCLC